MSQHELHVHENKLSRQQLDITQEHFEFWPCLKQLRDEQCFECDN